MKNKPVAHKTTNRFQFKSFNEQLASVEIKYGRHELKNRHLYEDSEECKFLQTLLKWEDLNCTQDFFDLKCKIGPTLSVTTLAQIVHRKDHLIETLKCCLQNSENKALEVALELVVALAFDLRNEFYPYFLEIFDVLINLLDIQDSNLLENIFMCFAYMFKSLWRYILNDFRTVLIRFSHKLLAKDRKEYIRNFAAQSFSFLMRKVDDKEALLELIFGHLKNRNELSQGFGVLFFETVKGVHKQLHSCSPKFLESLLRISTNENWRESDAVFTAVKHCFDCLSKYITKQTSETVWNCLCDTLQKSDNSIVIGKISDILMLMLQCKDCTLVYEPEKLLSVLSVIISNRKYEQCVNLTLDCASTLITNLHSTISLKSITNFMKTVFSSELSEKTINYFVRSLISYVFFERDVLPHFLPYFSSHLKASSAEELLSSLEILVQIIVSKCHRPLLGCDLTSTVYSLHVPKLKNNNECLSDILVNTIQNSDCPRLVWCALMCVPHIKPNSSEEFREAIINRLKSSISQMKSEESENSTTVTEFIILECIFALYLLESHSLFDEVPCSEFVTIFRRRSSSVVMLQAFDFYLQSAKRFVKIDALDLRYFESLFDELKINLSSPIKSVRLLTLHIAVLFNPPLPATESADSVHESVFQICLNAEVLPVCVEQYREKLRILQKLESGANSTMIPIEAVTGYSYELVPVYSLLGSLYANLSLLWSPINNVIDVYTRSLKNFDDFWRVILEHYSQTLNFITDNPRVINNFFHDLNFNEIFDEFYEKTYRLKEDRADHYNHRILVLKLLKLLSDLMEKKNRDFIQWFFEFLENESSVINIKRDTLTEDITLETSCEDDEKISESNGKLIWRTLISFLEVFAKFRNPKAMYKEKEVHLIFDSLLQHKDNILQKTTFDCILAYDYRYITPYKDNFLRLIDNKTFKSEIVNFNLNPANEEYITIKDEHRSDLMPYLMRILYGKMLSKTGANTSGQSKSTLRRSIVFRFLAGCPEQELRLFFNLAFSSVSNIFSLDLNSVAEYYTNIDLKKSIPIRTLLSSMKTLEVMLFSLGNISKKLLPDFFKILIAIASIATSLLQQRNFIKESTVTKLKVLRSECLKVGTKFFQVFDEYNYSSEEIDVFFKCVVWPLLPLFSNESLASPSPLLKLFVGWSENPRYFDLLMKAMLSNDGLYPLCAVMDLYADSKCHQSVTEVVSAMIVNLLTLDNFDAMESETGEMVEKLKINGISKISDELMEHEVNYGIQILFPFVDKIVSRLKINFDERHSSSKRKKCLMTTDELTILTTISPFVKDELQCKKMAKLLVGTFTEKQRRSAETDCQTLHTIYSLLKETSTADDDFIVRFIPLFRFISERNARLELCNILATIIAKEKSFSLLGNSVAMINSYNPRNPEEPDYGLRMDGFKIINDSLDNLIATENCNILDLLVYNCCFFISCVDDLGVREVSSDLIQTIVRKVNDNHPRATFVKVCIDTLFLKEIRVGLRQKNENVRHEFLSILSTLIRTGHEKNPLLSQLYLLCDEDDELDFYTTIKHIQLHRRSRTLNRFVRNADVLQKLSSKVLSSYILPIATSFLFDIHCRKNSGLTDASIEAVLVICRHLEWPVYNRILTHYLDLLTKDYENHKMIVKILSAILNNFAFDLSEAVDLSKTENETDVSAGNTKKPKPTMAVKIYDYIVNQLLPKLHKHLHTFSRADYEYDAMKDEYPEDNEIQRVPLAFAIVKLLQALPEKSNLLESNIPSVFLRLLHFLKSKSEGIRETARSSLIKVMQAVGPRFFPYLLREMQSMLTKGYQVHVLTYTLYAVVSSLQSQLKPGDFDPCLSNIVDICVQEIFSDFSEEKEVSKIVAKVKEARKSKSFDTFFSVACFASEQSLTKMIVPLKNILSESHSHKVLKKVSRCLQKVIIGLTENTSLSESSLLTFFYGIVHDSIPELQSLKQKKVSSSLKIGESTYLLLQKPAKKDSKKKPKINSNQFILVQESLRILHILLKRDRLKSTNADHVALLEPFVAILSSFVQSDHPKLTIMALKCLNLIILRFSSLQSFKTYANTIKNDLFVLMHKHTGVGMQHGDNYELIIVLFKTMHYLISEIDEVQLDEKQLEVLLVYAEKDIYENSKQAVAFSMLKAIISRRLQSPALAEIMKKLSEMLVQSEHEYVRKQCVQIWMRYLLDFSHGKNLKSHLMFFLRQLDYEYESGRQSVLELLMLVVSRFPEVAFNSYIDLIFIPVASRLINEESTNTRKFAADVLIKLLQRSDISKRNILFENIVVSWFQQKNALQKQLAARLCSLFADVEQEHFSRRLQVCIPLLRESLKSCDVNEDNGVHTVTHEDHLLYHLLLLFLRILKSKPEVLKREASGEDVNEILHSVVEVYLLHPHVWVRVVSVDIVEFVFSTYSVDEVVTAIVQAESSEQYMLNNACSVVWNLCLKFLDLLRNVNDCGDLANPLIRNMVFIGKVITRLPEDWESTEETKQRNMSIKWLINRMSREVRREISEDEKCCVKRSLIFKWIAAIVLEMKKEQLCLCLQMLLTPLCREVTKVKGDENKKNSDVIILAEDVLKVIQGAVGKEAFSSSYAKVVSMQSRKRMHRKNQRAIELIMNPLKGLKRKHKKHVAFRENKKRKIAEKVGKKAKRRRL